MNFGCCIAAGVGQLLLWREGLLHWLFVVGIDGLLLVGPSIGFSLGMLRLALLLIYSCCGLRLAVAALGAEAPGVRCVDRPVVGFFDCVL